LINGAHAASERYEKTTCKVCHGFARFCKISSCPYYRNLFTEAVFNKLSSKNVSGPSPPTLLVSEKGYPKVVVGPAILLVENTSPDFLEKPADWLNHSVSELLRLRISLLFGRTVKPVKTTDKMVKLLKESAASSKPVDVEAVFSGGYSFNPAFKVRTAPYGPSAKLENMHLVGNVSVPRKVDSLIHDPDLSATEALTTLHEGGFDEYYLTRLFSMGLLGTALERKLVPTEWSITAVDDILSRKLYEKVRRHRVISEYRVHSYQAVENVGHVILTPTPWMYELLEGWLKHVNSSPYSDYEIHKPRTTYAENTGGAYYAVRLSILRHLHQRKEQGGAIVFFEIHPRWIPLGVWRFREIIREALKRPGEKFQTIDEAIEHVSKKLDIPINKYIAASKLIPFIRHQQKLG